MRCLLLRRPSLHLALRDADVADSPDLPIPASCRPAVSESYEEEAWKVARELVGLEFDGLRVRPGDSRNTNGLEGPHCAPRLAHFTSLACERISPSAGTRVPADGSTILILANADDGAAHQVAGALRLRRLSVLVCDALDKTVEITISADRSGATEVTMRAGVHRQTIGAVINRGGIAKPLTSSSEGKFLLAERSALWWAALGLFDGPVINRPTESGFLPNGDVASLAGSVDGIGTGARWTTWPDTPSAQAAHGHVNYHRVWGGAPVAHQGPDRSLSNEIPVGTILRATPFSRGSVDRILLAGDRMFTWSSFAEREFKWELALRELGSVVSAIGNYCLITLEHSGAKGCLLACDFFPTPDLYAHVADAAHDALAEYLTGAT